MQQELHLRDIFKILRKHRVSICLTFFGVLAIAMAVTFMTTPLYEAKTKLVIERSEPSNLTDRTPSVSRDPEFYETQYQFIRSRAVARRVVDHLAVEQQEMLSQLLVEDSRSLLKEWLDRAKTLVGWTGNEAIEEEKPADPHERLARMISEGIKVRPVENSRLVQIGFLATDPLFASQVVNTVVDSYRAEINQMKMETSKQSMDWMNRKADSESVKLRAAEDNLQKYMGDNSVLTLENRIAIIPEKLSRLSGELVTAEARRQQLEALMAKVDKFADNPDAAESVSAVLSDSALQSLRAEIVGAEKTILELSGKYGPKHPVMLKAVGDLDILQRKKNQEIARIVSSIRNDYELAQANERNLRVQLEQTKTEALKMNEKFMEFQTLKTEVDANRKLVDALVTRMKEEGITSESQSVKMWVVEKAAIPQSPARPLKALNLSLGMVLGLLGGAGLAFFREYLDNSIKNPDEAELAFDTPVLGTISLSRRERIEQIVLEEPLSAFAEGYKSLRTIILNGGARCRKVLLTSSLPGEGKTTTSVNLAIALAQADKRVLLIDADLRKPRVHDIFRLNNRQGLSRLLSQPGAQEITSCLQPGPCPNLTVLTAGPIPPNPSELLQSKRMKDLLHLLAEKFDYIICDSPPVLAVEDSRILSALFDSILLVAKAHMTSFEEAGRSLKQLRCVKAPVLGIVVNGLDQRKTDYYYHRQYYSAYQEKPLKLQA
ncbi:MAG: polysaccharide biosynthesis tyrosine autokinase [Desulfuromonadales bacterium]